MGSTTPCASHFAHSFSREALAAHEATCPTVTHALVPELYSALDPEFITVQVRRKVFSYSLFNILGEAMKVHCAPVRDALVNDMVETAFRGDIAGSLRKCFDCVEIMKLVSHAFSSVLIQGHCKPSSACPPSIPLESRSESRVQRIPKSPGLVRDLAAPVFHLSLDQRCFSTCYQGPLPLPTVTATVIALRACHSFCC